MIDCSGDGEYRIRGCGSCYGSAKLTRPDAYAGGGRRIERVEVSLDAGKTWLLAECDYPEDLYRAVALSDPVYGRIDLTESDRNFCWMFWSYTVPVKRLGESSSIMVRAMDESLALQPAEMCAFAASSCPPDARRRQRDRHDEQLVVPHGHRRRRQLDHPLRGADHGGRRRCVLGPASVRLRGRAVALSRSFEQHERS